MSDLYNSLFEASWRIAPLFAFLIGLTGSIHCVGMCGGLVLAVSKTKKDPWLYNLGRLLGYLIIAILFSSFSNFMSTPEAKNRFSIAGGTLLGIYFIIVGVKAMRGRELTITLPILHKAYGFLFGFFNRTKIATSFGIGASSILLPCALSNSFIFAALSLGGFLQASAVVVFFWAGTLPAMIIGPELFRSLSSKVGYRSQKVLGIMFVLAGVISIGVKLSHAYSLDLFCL